MEKQAGVKFIMDKLDILLLQETWTWEVEGDVVWANRPPGWTWFHSGDDLDRAWADAPAEGRSRPHRSAGVGILIRDELRPSLIPTPQLLRARALAVRLSQCVIVNVYAVDSGKEPEEHLLWWHHFSLWVATIKRRYPDLDLVIAGDLNGNLRRHPVTGVVTAADALGANVLALAEALQLTIVNFAEPPKAPVAPPGQAGQLPPAFAPTFWEAPAPGFAAGPVAPTQTAAPVGPCPSAQAAPATDQQTRDHRASLVYCPEDITWMSGRARGATLDYILSSTAASNFLISQVPIATDHLLISCCLHLPRAEVHKPAKQVQARRLRLRLLREAPVAAAFVQELSARSVRWEEVISLVSVECKREDLPTADRQQLVDVLQAVSTHVYLAAAEKALGYSPNRHRRTRQDIEWTTALRDAQDLKSRLHAIWCQSPNDKSRAEYVQARRHFTSLIKRAQADATAARAETIAAQARNPKTLWSLIQRRLKPCRATAASHIAPAEWVSSMSQSLFRAVDPSSVPEDIQGPPASHVATPVSQQELGTALRKAASHKARGPDQATNELFKAGGMVCASRLLLPLFNAALDCCLTPRAFREANILPVGKPGADLSTPAGFRPIALSSHAGKVFERILLERLGNVEQNLSAEQGGFRKGKGCRDELLALKELIASRGKRRKPTYVAFLDVKGAYDNIPRAKIWQGLRRLEAEEGVIRLIQSFYVEPKTAVIVNGTAHAIPSVPTSAGVRQGSVLSPLLFNIAMEGLVDRIVKSGVGVRIQDANDRAVGARLRDRAGRTIGVILYADDIAVVAESKQDLQKLLDVCNDFARDHELQFNLRKSLAVAFFAQAESEDWRPHIGEEAVPVGTQYKYLGVEFDSRLKWAAFAERKITKFRAASARALLVTAGRFNPLPLPLAINVWRALALPHLTYGMEVVEFNATQYKALNHVIHEALRRLLGLPTYSKTLARLHETGQLEAQELCNLRKLQFANKLLETAQDPTMSDRNLASIVFNNLPEPAESAVAADRGKPKRAKQLDGRLLVSCLQRQYHLQLPCRRPGDVADSVHRSVLRARLAELATSSSTRCAGLHPSFGLTPALGPGPDQLGHVSGRFIMWQRSANRVLAMLRADCYPTNVRLSQLGGWTGVEPPGLCPLGCHEPETLRHLLFTCKPLFDAHLNAVAWLNVTRRFEGGRLPRALGLHNQTPADATAAWHIWEQASADDRISLILSAGHSAAPETRPSAVRRVLGYFGRRYVWNIHATRAWLMWGTAAATRDASGLHFVDETLINETLRMPRVHA